MIDSMLSTRVRVYNCENYEAMLKENEKYGITYTGYNMAYRKHLIEEAKKKERHSKGIYTPQEQ